MDGRRRASYPQGTPLIPTSPHRYPQHTRFGPRCLALRVRTNARERTRRIGHFAFEMKQMFWYSGWASPRRCTVKEEMMFLGWYDPDKKKPARHKVEEAIERYVEKFGGAPEAILTSVADAVELTA